MMVKRNSSQWIKSGVFLSVLIFLVRLTIIEADPPEWDVAHYQPVDESYYVYVAYNAFERGEINADGEALIFGTPLLTNWMAYLTLNLFGDSYLGLRFGSWFFALLSMLLIFQIVRQFTSNKSILFFTPIIVAVNMQFMLAGTIVEPTIARVFTALLTILLIGKVGKLVKGNFVKYSISGFVSCLLMVLAHPTNAFIIPAIFLGLSIYQLSRKSGQQFFNVVVKNFISYGFGVILAIGLYLFIALALGENILNTSVSRGGGYSNRVDLNITGVLINLITLFKANIFVFNPIYLILFIASLTLIWVRKLKDWPLELILTYVSLIFFLIQTAFINDFPERKLVFLFPFVVIIVAYLLSQEKAELICKAKQLKLFKRINLCHLFLFLSLVAIITRIAAILGLGAYFPIITNLFAVVLLGLWFFRKRIKLGLVSLSIVSVLCVDLLTNIQYHLIPLSYHYRDAMSSLNEYKNQTFLGGWSMGFRTGNSTNPRVNQYFYGKKLDLKTEAMIKIAKMEKDKSYYSIDRKRKTPRLTDKVGFETIGFLMNERNTVHGEPWIIYKLIFDFD